MKRKCEDCGRQLGLAAYFPENEGSDHPLCKFCRDALDKCEACGEPLMRSPVRCEDGVMRPMFICVRCGIGQERWTTPGHMTDLEALWKKVPAPIEWA